MYHDYWGILSFGSESLHLRVFQAFGSTHPATLGGDKARVFKGQEVACIRRQGNEPWTTPLDGGVSAACLSTSNWDLFRTCQAIIHTPLL